VLGVRPSGSYREKNRNVSYFQYGAAMTDGETLASLPRGPHRLTRAQVRDSQRERLYRAIIDAVADQGYAGTSVGDVLARARVSRATFYEHFADKEDCFLSAYDATLQGLLDRIRTIAADATAEDGGPRVGELIDAYIATIAADRRVARVFLIEVYAVGPKALDRRQVVLERFVDLLSGLLTGTPGWPANPVEHRLRCEAFVGALSSMVTTRVAREDFDTLAQLREPVLALAGLDA
jgi:AcrR family transcriptional regulator